MEPEPEADWRGLDPHTLWTPVTPKAADHSFNGVVFDVTASELYDVRRTRKKLLVPAVARACVRPFVCRRFSQPPLSY
eukprot:SAG22_NODE_398_length_11106_cov_67.829836_12_plen_78_part_00